MRYLLVTLLAISLSGCGCSSGCNGKASANDLKSDTRVAVVAVK